MAIAFIAIISCTNSKNKDKSKIESIKKPDKEQYIDINFYEKNKISNELANKAINLKNSSKITYWHQDIQSFSNIENITKQFIYKKNNKNKEKSIFKFKKSIIAKIYSFYNKSQNFTFSPTIKNDIAYILSPSGKLLAINLINGNKLWQRSVFNNIKILYKAPKLSISNNKIFAIIGDNTVKAFNIKNGNILWQKKLATNITSIANNYNDLNDKLAILTVDNRLYMLDGNDGSIIWNHFTNPNNVNIFNSSNPIFYQNILLVGYGSGELYALNIDDGKVLWNRNLNKNNVYNSDFYLSDIDANLLIKDDVIYAISNSGIFTAINIKSNQTLWQESISSITNFWISDDFIYLIDNQSQLLTIDKNSGKIKQILQLPTLLKPKKPKSRIIYNGILMADNKLIISDYNGKITIIDPITNAIITDYNSDLQHLHAPILVNNKIYIHYINKFSSGLAAIE